MHRLSLIFAPNKIFSQKASVVDVIDDEIKNIAEEMIYIMNSYKAYGIAANMVGVLKRIITVNTSSTKNSDLVMINPEIIYSSKETHIVLEGSLSFVGIESEITRPKEIKINYQDLDGSNQTFEASGLLSSVIQHQIDYLDGKTFLDHLSKMKKDLLIKKMQKHMRLNPPHVHTADCRH